MNKELAFRLLDVAMAGPHFALQKSYPKYAMLREQIVKGFSQVTGIPEEEFEDYLCLQTARALHRKG